MFKWLVISVEMCYLICFCPFCQATNRVKYW